MRSGSGEARTILLFHIISARPSKQPRMVRTFHKVYMELGSSSLFLQEQIKDIIIKSVVGHRPVARQIICCESHHHLNIFSQRHVVFAFKRQKFTDTVLSVNTGI